MSIRKVMTLASATRWQRVAPIAIITFCVAAVAPSQAGLVAKWDFDNYDPENPTSAAILAPAVGSLSAIPCTGTTDSTEVTDGTLGSITVVNTGLPEGDYALSIPKGAHLKIPLPSGIVHDKCWSLRIRFYYPGTAKTLNTLVSGEYTGVGNGIWYVSGNNLIQGSEGLFGTASEENQNTVGNAGSQKNNGWNAFRLVSRNAWHSFTAHFGPDGTSSTLDGYRCVSLTGKSDIRARFTDDGFVLCASNSSALTYVSSIEVWEDTPVYRDTNGGAYIPTASRTVFAGCSLETLRDMYISVKGLGSWEGYARSMSSWEHIVTTDGEGNVTDLKIDLRGKAGADAILCDFTQSGDDVAGNTLRDQWSLAWPNPYFTTSGDFTSSSSYQAAPANWNGSGYSAYNIYALPFRPIDDSLNWSMQMGTGKFGNPIFSIVGDNPTLTFNVAPQADSITLDCGRGDGKASVTFAYGSAALKTMSGLGGLNITDGVTLNIPSGVSITGALTFTAAAKMALDVHGQTLSVGEVLFTAAGGITLPAGKTINDVVSFPRGSAELSQDGTQILFAPDPSIPFTATWTGGGDRNNASDPLNWDCRNHAGTVLPGVLPDENTAVTASGTTDFNIPEGQAIRYFTLALQGTLSADCDWRGLGPDATFVAGSAMNLNGHNLVVAGLGSSAAATIRNDNSGTISELCVSNVADTANTQVAIAGNIKFVKKGEGEFLAGKGQSYTGGTELQGGVTRVSLNATQQTTMGASGKDIFVRTGATLQMEGQVWFSVYRIVLDGGTVQSNFSEALGKYTGGAIFGNAALLSNSTLRTIGTGNLRFWAGNLLNLNGNTVDVEISDAGSFLIASDFASIATFSNGTMNVTGGTFKTYPSFPGTLEAKTVTLRMNSAMNISDACTINLRDYEALYDGTANTGTGALNVFGTFKPSAHDKFYGVKMQDGSTIDLSSRTNALPLVSAFTTGANTLSFADNSTVYINVGNLEVDSKNPAITWTEKPANIGTVKFKSADPEWQRSFVSRNDGVYAISGFMLLIK